MSDLISNLTLKIRDFIKFKNSLGIEYKTGLYYLKQLDKYNYEHGNYDDLKKISLKTAPCSMPTNPLQETGAGYPP
ncbi:hypothetical protein [Clostridium estertheticum]|uniref:hypothetical protein n=1 Tax=Clostridium estertheticum TaxID=238834 RepID=UPI001C7CEBF0|nr:hypothetical protein [Clostridium estertheticum]MBX4266305.1 hypothetical protein [Clostridium estertheticum]WLC90004.1 hypothetical protein KTC95_07380 [Clostridium estertheticum]